jgi:hypothetical protein
MVSTHLCQRGMVMQHHFLVKQLHNARQWCSAAVHAINIMPYIRNFTADESGQRNQANQGAFRASSSAVARMLWPSRLPHQSPVILW